MVLRTGPFHGKRDASRFTRPYAQTLGNIELTFLGYPFESFGRAFDPVLAVITIGRKQPNDLISAAGGRTSHIARGKIDSLSNVVFVLQRLLHHAKNVGRAHGPAASIDWKTRCSYNTPPVLLASYISTWQLRRICRFFSTINACLGVPDETAEGGLEPSRPSLNRSDLDRILARYRGDGGGFPSPAGTEGWREGL